MNRLSTHPNTQKLFQLGFLLLLTTVFLTLPLSPTTEVGEAVDADTPQTPSNPPANTTSATSANTANITSNANDTSDANNAAVNNAANNPLRAGVAIIPIEGDIEPAVYVFLKRAIDEAKEQGYTRIVFKINTFGGRLDTAYNIVQLLTTTAQEGIFTTAWVEDKAISAGTLIALSTKQIYMMPGSTMGDVAPVAVGQEGVTVLGEKFQSPLRAKFRALAEQNDYPVKLTEAFVSPERAIYEVTTKDGMTTFLNDNEYDDLTEAELANIVKRRTIIAEGELLTMNESEAIALGFSRGTVSSLAEIFGPTFDETLVQTFEVTESEKILSWMTRYAGIFIFIALAGFYLEAQNPGFGLFGTLAIIVLGTLVLGLFAVELATYGELALLLGGLLLIAVEIFILPGTVVAGLLGVVSLLAALILMLQDFAIPDSAFENELFRQNLITVALAFVGGTVVFFASFLLLKNWRHRNPLVFHGALSQEPQDLLLHTPLNDGGKGSEKDSSSNNNNNTLTTLIEAEGLALSDLRPSGKVRIGDEIYDALSGGDYIRLGEAIVVTDVQQSSLIVAKKR